MCWVTLGLDRHVGDLGSIGASGTWARSARRGLGLDRRVGDLGSIGASGTWARSARRGLDCSSGAPPRSFDTRERLARPAPQASANPRGAPRNLCNPSAPTPTANRGAGEWPRILHGICMGLPAKTSASATSKPAEIPAVKVGRFESENIACRVATHYLRFP